MVAYNYTNTLSYCSGAQKSEMSLTTTNKLIIIIHVILCGKYLLFIIIKLTLLKIF